MNVAIVDGTGTVISVLVIPDGWTIAADGSAASGPSHEMVIANDGTVTPMMGTSSMAADAGTTLVASNTASVGWTWTQSGGFVAPSSP